MALHRDIFWVGRQWAVTGFGVQAVDPRLKGAFDVEVARLWDDELPQRMRSLAWINIDDFNRALDLARTRFHERPSGKAEPLVESVLGLIQPPAPTKAAPPMEAKRPAPDSSVTTTSPPAPIEPPRQKSLPLAMRIEGASAKFAPSWRVWHDPLR